jgi:hypothetical protein
MAPDGLSRTVPTSAVVDHLGPEDARSAVEEEKSADELHEEPPSSVMSKYVLFTCC